MAAFLEWLVAEPGEWEHGIRRPAVARWLRLGRRSSRASASNGSGCHRLASGGACTPSTSGRKGRHGCADGVGVAGVANEPQWRSGRLENVALHSASFGVPTRSIPRVPPSGLGRDRLSISSDSRKHLAMMVPITFRPVLLPSPAAPEWLSVPPRTSSKSWLADISMPDCPVLTAASAT